MPCVADSHAVVTSPWCLLQKLQVNDYVVFEVVDGRPEEQRGVPDWPAIKAHMSIRMHVFRARLHDARFATGAESAYGACAWHKVGGSSGEESGSEDAAEAGDAAEEADAATGEAEGAAAQTEGAAVEAEGAAVEAEVVTGEAEGSASAGEVQDSGDGGSDGDVQGLEDIWGGRGNGAAEIAACA